MREMRFGGLLALAASLALGWGASTARAGLAPDDPIIVNGAAYNTMGQLATIWGTHATLGHEDNGLPHLFSGSSLYDDDSFWGGGFNVGVSSSELTPLPGQGFTAELVIDYTMGFLPLGAGYEHRVEILDITDGAAIENVEVNVGVVNTDGFSISWSAIEGDILDAGGVVTITWGEPIPAPGALALLGLAGLAVGRRRRRR